MTKAHSSRDKQLRMRLAYAVLLCLAIPHAALAQQSVQMNFNQLPGCTFSNIQRGELGITQDWATLSTDLPDGRRPSVRVLNTGQVVLNANFGYAAWTHNGAPFSMVRVIMQLRDQPTLGNVVPVPLALLNPGYRDLYLEATGTSSRGTLPAGLYKASITLSCM